MRPPVSYEETTTGYCRPRKTWFGKFVMQIEIKRCQCNPWILHKVIQSTATFYWRDIKESDIEYERFRLKGTL